MEASRCVHGMLRGQCAACKAAHGAGHARSRAAKKKPGALAMAVVRNAPKRKRRTGTHAQPQKAQPKSTKPAASGTAPDYDSGVRFSPDPDAATKSVWAFKTGHSYHRRDCHIVESHDGAVLIPLVAAKRRRLERCMHCAPTVQ